MKTEKINIPSPCNKIWQNMKPNGSGRYCDSCQKTVIDFTALSDADLINYFKKNKTNNVCGYFKTAQIDNNPTPQFLLLLNQKFQNIRFKPLKSGLMFLMGIAMFISGCQNFMMGKKSEIIGDTICEPLETKAIMHDSLRLMGEPMLIEPKANSGNK